MHPVLWRSCLARWFSLLISNVSALNFMPRFGNFARCSARNTTVLVHHFMPRFVNFARCSARNTTALVHHFKLRFKNYALNSARNTTFFRHLALPRIIALFFLVFISVQQASSQDTLNDTIRAMLLEVSENRLLDHVRELENAGGTRNRVTFTAGKDSAEPISARFLSQCPESIA
jgi:hypothetical protein